MTPVFPSGDPAANVGKKLPFPAGWTRKSEAGVMTTTINAAAAGTWQLGDRTVNRLGFGAMRLMSKADGSPSDRTTVETVLHKAIELGVNHIDTAAFYFSKLRSANELINTVLAPYPDDLVITTKVGPGRDPAGNWVRASTKDELRGQVEENIRQLGLDHLDVVNLRIGEGLERGTGDIRQRFEVLAELQQEGLIRHLGISNVGPEHVKQALEVAQVVCVQNQYGLVTRREDDALIALCQENNVAFVPFFAIGAAIPGASPFGPANETGKDVVAEVAAGRGATEAQIRLAWTLHKGRNVLAIPGTGNPAHLEENVAASALHLTDDEMSRLDTIG
jgi:aryl-alcohol dehydrogenase-like predicted oxidoreductase